MYEAVDLIVLSLAVWRTSSLLVRERGPADVFTRLRVAAGVRVADDDTFYGETIVGEALTCLWCTSIWVALVAATGYLVAPVPTLVIVLPLALSAGAILVDGGVS